MRRTSHVCAAVNITKKGCYTHKLHIRNDREMTFEDFVQMFEKYKNTDPAIFLIIPHRSSSGTQSYSDERVIFYHQRLLFPCSRSRGQVPAGSH